MHYLSAYPRSYPTNTSDDKGLSGRPDSCQGWVTPYAKAQGVRLVFAVERGCNVKIGQIPHQLSSKPFLKRTRETDGKAQEHFRV